MKEVSGLFRPCVASMEATLTSGEFEVCVSAEEVRCMGNSWENTILSSWNESYFFL